jgi:hypothetical protein
VAALNTRDAASSVASLTCNVRHGPFNLVLNPDGTGPHLAGSERPRPINRSMVVRILGCHNGPGSTVQRYRWDLSGQVVDNVPVFESPEITRMQIMQGNKEVVNAV